MRLGAYACSLVEGSFCKKVYDEDLVYERHRHRFEFNNQYKKFLKEDGLKIAGICLKENLVEIVEIKNHVWFVGVQFHMEFNLP